MNTNIQYWFEVKIEDYDAFDHELRNRGIFPHAAHELVPGKTIIIYFEATQDVWNEILLEWKERYV